MHTHGRRDDLQRPRGRRDNCRTSTTWTYQASIGVYPELDLEDWLPPLSSEPETVDLVESSDEDEDNYAAQSQAPAN